MRLRDELVGMGFFAKVKMRVHGVFQQMDRAISGHDQRRSQPRIQPDTFRRHLEQGSGHQKSRAQRDKVAQIAFHAARAHQHQPAGHVSQCGNGSENE